MKDNKTKCCDKPNLSDLTPSQMFVKKYKCKNCGKESDWVCFKAV